MYTSLNHSCVIANNYISIHEQFTRTEVDGYVVGSIPPSCQLDLHLKRMNQPYERLSHQIEVNGIQGMTTITVIRDIDLGKLTGIW